MEGRLIHTVCSDSIIKTLKKGISRLFPPQGSDDLVGLNSLRRIRNQHLLDQLLESIVEDDPTVVLDKEICTSFFRKASKLSTM